MGLQADERGLRERWEVDEELCDGNMVRGEEEKVGVSLAFSRWSRMRALERVVPDNEEVAVQLDVYEAAGACWMLLPLRRLAGIKKAVRMKVRVRDESMGEWKSERRQGRKVR